MIRTGIDLVDIKRIQGALSKTPKIFLERIATPSEISWIETHKRVAEKAAGVFALKEAFSKALGTGIGEFFGFHDVEVSYLPSGQPVLKYVGEKFQSESRRWQVSCSLSHEGDLVAAVVVLLNAGPELGV